MDVCIVSWNSADDLPGCLAAVASQEHRPLRVIVVDCGSEDDSLAAARAEPDRGPPRQVIPLGENRGFAGGMNEAVRRGASPWILSLNPDARPRPDYVARLVERARRTPGWRVGAVTGRLVRPPNGGQVRLDACGIRLQRTWRHFDRGSDEPDRGQHHRAERVFGVSGAASLFSREALDDVAFPDGPFDPRFHSFREDAELAFRLRERGWEALYEPAAVAEHRRHVLPSRRRRLSPAINRHSLKNRYLIRAYHQTSRNLLWTGAHALARDLAALLWVLAVERSSLPAYAWLWRHRREIVERRRWVQARRTRPESEIDVWFRREALPL